MRTAVKITYYLSFGWLIILVTAELGALIMPGVALFSVFLGKYFFSWLTYFAMGFVLVRFIVIVIADIRAK